MKIILIVIRGKCLYLMVLKIWTNRSSLYNKGIFQFLQQNNQNEKKDIFDIFTEMTLQKTNGRSLIA